MSPNFVNPFDIFYVLWLATGTFWPVSFTVLGLLIWVGLWTSRKLLKAVTLTVAGLLAISGIFASMQVSRDRRERQHEIAVEQSMLTLSSPVTTPDLTLPAGTKVHWVDSDEGDHPKELVHFRALLPGPTPALGLLLNGYLMHEGNGWGVHLAQDEVVDGWPCRKGDDTLLTDILTVQSCTLGHDFVWHGRLLPAGTFMQGDSIPGNHLFQLPAHRTMELQDLHVIVPEWTALTLHADGSVVDIGFTNTMHGDGHAPFQARGLPMGTLTVLYPGQEEGDERQVPGPPYGFKGELAGDFPCGSRTLKKLEVVRVGWTGQTVVDTPNVDPHLNALPAFRLECPLKP